MKKLLLALPVLALTACTGGKVTPEQIAAIIPQIQAYTAAACAFQPTAATVANLVAAFYPDAQIGATVVSQIGDAICKAPTTASVKSKGVTTVSKTVATPKGKIIVKGVSYVVR